MSEIPLGFHQPLLPFKLTANQWIKKPGYECLLQMLGHDDIMIVADGNFWTVSMTVTITHT